MHGSYKKVIDVSSWTSMFTICVSYQIGKNWKIPFGLSNKIFVVPQEKLHCDLSGPTPIASTWHFRYYVILNDDYSKYTWLLRLRKKSDFHAGFLKFQRMVEDQFDPHKKISKWWRWWISIHGLSKTLKSVWNSTSNFISHNSWTKWCGGIKTSTYCGNGSYNVISCKSSS